MEQRIICHPLRYDNDGPVARSARARLVTLLADLASRDAFDEHLLHTFPGGLYCSTRLDGDCTLHSSLAALSALQIRTTATNPHELRQIIADFLGALPGKFRHDCMVDEMIPNLRAAGNYQGIQFELVYMAMAYIFSVAFTVVSQSMGPPFVYTANYYDPGSSAQEFGLQVKPMPIPMSKSRVCFAQSESRQHTDVYIYEPTSEFL